MEQGFISNAIQLNKSSNPFSKSTFTSLWDDWSGESNVGKQAFPRCGPFGHADSYANETPSNEFAINEISRKVLNDQSAWQTIASNKASQWLEKTVKPSIGNLVQHLIHFFANFFCLWPASTSSPRVRLKTRRSPIRSHIEG